MDQREQQEFAEQHARTLMVRLGEDHAKALQEYVEHAAILPYVDQRKLRLAQGILEAGFLLLLQSVAPRQSV